MPVDVRVRQAEAREPASRPVLTKDLAERRVPALGLGAVLVVLSLGALGAASGLEDTIGDITENFPEALQAFIPADVPGGYVVGEVFDLIAPLALVAYAVLTGASATAGEEQVGTMSLLSAQPVSRRALLGWKVLGLLSVLAALVVVFCASAWAAATVFDLPLGAAGIAATGLHLFLLAALFGSIALAVGALTGNPTAAAAVAGGLAVVAYLSDAMLPLADLDGWAELSPWHYYASSVPLVNGVDVGHVGVLAALAVLALALAAAAFVHRDLQG